MLFTLQQEWAKDSGNLDTSIANQLSKDQFTVALFEIFGKAAGSQPHRPTH